MIALTDRNQVLSKDVVLQTKFGESLRRPGQKMPSNAQPFLVSWNCGKFCPRKTLLRYHDLLYLLTGLPVSISQLCGIVMHADAFVYPKLLPLSIQTRP
jgi:hypothetical protein